MFETLTEPKTEIKNLQNLGRSILSEVARKKEISKGLIFMADKQGKNHVLKYMAGYACGEETGNQKIIEFGEGFPGQVAKDGRLMNISEIPDGYMTIESGLGKSSPASLIIFPVKHEGKTLAVVELASFHRFTKEDEDFFSSLSPSIGDRLVQYFNNPI
jgi:GAF domain-containing protein